MTITIEPASAKLTPVERAFVERVIRSICAVAEREGARPIDVLRRPMQERALGVDGVELLRRHGVQAAIYEIVRETSAGASLTLEGMINELWAIVHSNVDDFLVDFIDGNRDEIDWSKVPREKLAAVKSVQIERFPDGRTKKKMEFWSKIDAIKIAPDIMARLPAGHRYKALDIATPGQSVTLPATITEQEAAERYARALNDDAS